MAMKKYLKAIAVFLAAAMMFTACAGGADNSDSEKIDKKALSEYEKASVTQVKDQTYTFDEREGLYTGDWKGNRPEGQGKLVISSDEYYSGEWSNGSLMGQGEMKNVYDDGSYRYYKGECLYNQPDGKGQLIYGYEDGSLMQVEGDFNDESTLICYLVDEKGKLVDVGGMHGSEFTSYVDNVKQDVAIDYIDDSDLRAIYYERGFYTLEYGKYIGQTDENGIPNGYGYYEAFFNYANNPAIDGELVSSLGTWTDGHITDGYYTSLEQQGQWSLKKLGCKKDGDDVGEYISYEDFGYKFEIYSKNFDTHDVLMLCDDGEYRTPYDDYKCYYDDGTYTYQKTCRRLTNNQNAVYNALYEGEWVSRCVLEGEYYTYDNGGNLTDYGIVDPECAINTLAWKSSKPKDDSIWTDIAVVGALMLSAYAGYKFFAWSMSSFEDSAEAKALESHRIRMQESVENHAIKKELLKKAEEEERLGNTYEAEKYRREAKNYW